MSMLAERKRKTKWVINPTKKPLWSTDSNGIKFGKGLMEKMGWSVGEGLGVNRQGIQEPLKVSYKNDTKGVGFKGNDDDWIEHQDEFNSFLNQLRNNNESVIVKESDIKKDEVKSLEEKSKWSKARVHYRKFTSGKDLSKYSENDLGCILGTNKAKKEKFTANESIKEDSKTNDNFETHFGVTTINSGSIQDYFKKKWVSHKKLSDTCDAGDEATQNYQSENFYSSPEEKENIKDKDKDKTKRKKLELNSDEFVNLETTMSLESNELEQIEKKKKKKREKVSHFEEQPEIKKRKRNYDFDFTNEIDQDSVGKDKESTDVFVAQNKNDDCNLENINVNLKSILKVNKISNELKNQKKKKKEKKEGKNNGNTFSILGDIKESFSHESETSKENNSEKENNVFEEELIPKKKKKKSKKEKNFKNNEIENKVSLDASDSTLNKQKSFVKEEFKCFKTCNDEKVNSGLDEDNIKNTKETKIEKKNKEEKLIEAEEIDPVGKVKSSFKKEIIKDTSNIEFCDLELILNKRKKRDKREKSIEKKIDENKNGLEVMSEIELDAKKKKKKNKEEKLDEKKIDVNINEVDVISKVEFIAKKKKKKDKREKLIERESDRKANEIEVISEVELDVKKKKKKNKEEDSAERESDNNINEVEVMPEVEFIAKKKKKKDKREKSIERESDKNINEIEAMPEVEFVAKKKKKKDKREKSIEKESDRKTNEIEVMPEVEFVKKEKKKKKSKKENSVEREENKTLTNDGNNISNHKSKKGRQDTPEIEFIKTKKIKKGKKEKSLKIENSSIEVTDELEVKKENFKITHKKKPSPVVELKCEKGKIIKGKEIELPDNCTNDSIEPESEKEKTKNNNEVEDISEVALARKKKKKKDKIKEVINDENSKNFLQIEKSNCEIEEKNTQDAKLLGKKKANNSCLNHQNNNISNLNFSYSYNCNNSKKYQKNSRGDGEHGIQNPIKEELLNVKKADKFYPNEDRTHKILRLLYLSDLNQFKGSNVKKLVGYGFRRQNNQR